MGIFDQFKKVKKNENLEHLPPAFRRCGKLVKATFKNNTALPILMGYDKANADKVYFSLGTENPVVMSKEDVKYLVNATHKLFNELFDEEPVSNKGDVNTTDAFISPEDENVQASKELADLIGLNKTTENKLDKEKLKELIEEYKEVIESEEITEEQQAQRQDLEQIFENLSQEEKEELHQQMIEEQRKKTDEKFETLEEELLGEIKVEELPDFDFNYFDKIYQDKGLAYLREELSKIPKSDRQTMIEQFMTKYESAFK